MAKIKELEKNLDAARAEVESAKAEREDMLAELAEKKEVAELKGEALGIALAEGSKNVTGIATRIREAETESRAIAEALKVQESVIEHTKWLERKARRALGEVKINEYLDQAVEVFLGAGELIDQLEGVAEDLEEIYQESRQVDGAWNFIHDDYDLGRGHPDIKRRQIIHFADLLNRSVGFYRNVASNYQDEPAE